VGELGDAVGPPERVVEKDEVGLDRAQRPLQRPDPEREAVAVRGGEAERVDLVAAALVMLVAARDDHVMLEQPGGRRDPRLVLEIGANSAAPLAEEHRDVGDDRPRAAAGGRRFQAGTGSRLRQSFHRVSSRFTNRFGFSE
jgi:hypothetical protein